MFQWINKLSIKGKIATVGCLFLVPMVVAVYWIISGYSEDLAVARLEQAGNAYEAPLVDLLEWLPRHQALAKKYLEGRKEVRDQMVQSERQVDQAFHSLLEVNARYGAALQFTTEGLAKRQRDHYRVETVLGEWETLKRQSDTLASAASEAQHTHLVADVRTMITHAGDTSGLILDPDLDSYYLMDATLVGLPQTQDRLAVIQSTGEEFLGRAMTDAARLQCGIQAALLKEGDLDRITADLQTSLNEDQNFYGVSETLQRNLPPAEKEYVESTKVLLATMKTMGGSGANSISLREFSANAATARDASFKLWTVAARELDMLLDKRIGHFVGLRARALIATLLAMLVAGWFAYLVTGKMTTVLERAMRELGGQAAGIASAASQISSSSQSLAQAASDQASALQQTSESSGEINSLSRKNTENSRLAAEVMADVDRQVKAGNLTIDQMLASMHKITSSSDRISRIIKVIDGIAFQTNILALNAAVEAARAGEAGMGFAVVADEVRNLAQRSATAAKDTSELVEQSIASSGEGSSSLQKVAQVIAAITAGAAQMKSLAEEVSRGSQAESHSLDNIAKAVVRMNQVTQSTAARAEQSASASAELSAQGHALNQTVLEISALVSGQR